MLRNGTETKRLLVVSQDSAVLRPLWSMGELNCWRLETAVNAWEAIDRVQSDARLDLLLLDLPLETEDGMHILRWLRRLRPAMPIILIGHDDDAGRKQEWMRMGVREYFVKPIEDGRIETAIQCNLSVTCEAVETDLVSDDVEPVGNGRFFIGVSPIMRKLRAQAALLAEADVPVLILGEDGSGRETIARLIHKLSVRSGFEFAKVNCAALPADLLESELFGYRRNGTAAPPQTRTGKLELCGKGAILLGEITEMPQELQSKLLQVLQNKRFTRPGTSAIIEADVRVLAASSTNIERAVSESRLLEDFHQQLSAYTILVPPLRERKEEIPLLSRHYMHRIAKHYGLSPREISPAMIEAWQAYSWPGNLHELERCVKRYLMVGDEELAPETNRPIPVNGAQVSASDSAGNGNRGTLPGQTTATVAGLKSLRSTVQTVKREAERNAIAAALERTGWNRKAAARLLKVSYRTVLYKIVQYKMTPTNSTLFPGGIGNGNGANGFLHNGKTG